MWILRFNFYLVVGILFCVGSAGAQSVNFPVLWKEVLHLEKQGKLQEALSKVVYIQENAQDTAHQNQWIKTKLYQWKYHQTVSELATSKLFQELDQALENVQQIPAKNILYLYKAQLLEQYLSTHFWKISNRSSMQDAKPSLPTTDTNTNATNTYDFRLWDLKTFIVTLDGLYQNALKHPELLAMLPLDEVSVLLTDYDKELLFTTPSVLEVIATKALAFYQNQRNELSPLKPDSSAIPPFLVPKFTVSRLEAIPQDTLFFNKSMQIFGLVEYIQHQKKATHSSVLHWQLKRLSVASKQLPNTTSKQLGRLETHLKALENLEESYANITNTTTILPPLWIEKAQLLHQLSEIKDSNGHYKYKNYKNKALNWCEKVLLSDDASQHLKNKTQNLKQQILTKSLSWQTQDFYLPHQKHLAKVTYKNCSDFTLKVYKVPTTFRLEDFPYSNRDKAIKKYLSKKKPTLVENYELPKTLDYNTTSTEVIVPQLALGHYVFCISAVNSKSDFKYQLVRVTNIAVQKNNTTGKIVYQISHRNTGVPLKNTTVKYSLFKGYGKNKKTNTLNFTTDHKGYFDVIPPKAYRYAQTELLIAYQKDSLFLEDYVQYRNQSVNKQLKIQRKSLLFLDRGIYKLGDEIHFKTLSFSKTSSKQSTLQMCASQNLVVVCKNPAGKEVYKKTFTTSSLGSSFGSFQLPKEGLNGNYRITAYFENNTSEKIKNISEQRAFLNFRVEAYQKPNFEVVFDALEKEQYLPNTSISLSGKVKSYAGTIVSGAKIRYAITKQTYRYGFGYSRLPKSERQVVATGMTTAEESGAFSFDFKSLAMADTSIKENGFNNVIDFYKVSLSATSASGETHKASKMLKVSNKEVFSQIEIEAAPPHLLEVSRNTKTSAPVKINVTHRNCNQHKVNATGKLKLYRLKMPDTYLLPRPWAAPMQALLSQKDFDKNFPHIPYNDTVNNPAFWEEEKEVLVDSFTNSYENTTTLSNIQKLLEGAYKAEVWVKDTNGKYELTGKRIFYKDALGQIRFEKLNASGLSYQISYNRNDSCELNLNFDVPKYNESLPITVRVYEQQKLLNRSEFLLDTGKQHKFLELPSMDINGLDSYKRTVVISYQKHDQFFTHQEVLDYTPVRSHLEWQVKSIEKSMLPNSPQTWRFELRDTLMGKPITKGVEALVSMYDASLDTFAKSSWNTQLSIYKNRANTPLPKWINNTSYRSLSSSYHKPYLSVKYLQAPKFNDFGLQVEAHAYRGFGHAPVMMMSRSMPKSAPQLSRESKSIRAKSASTFSEEAAPEMLTDSSEVVTTEKESSLQEEINAVDLRSDFKQTAFFSPNITPNKSGEFIVKFTAPQSLSRWKFRLLAHNQAVQSAYYSADDIITQKPLSITTNTPRFFRAKDKLRFSAIVSNMESRTLQVQSRIRFFDPQNQKDITALVMPSQNLKNKALSLAPKTSNTVQWAIEIPEHYRNLGYVISTESEGFSDVVKEVVPVQSNRVQVTEATPIWVRGNSTEVYASNDQKTGKATEKATDRANNSKYIEKVVLEYTQNPSWLALKSLPYILSYNSECSEQVFTSYYAAILSEHLIGSDKNIEKQLETWYTVRNTPENTNFKSPLFQNKTLKNTAIAITPWFLEGLSETQKNEQLAVLYKNKALQKSYQKAFENLLKLQNSDGGFSWFKNGKSNVYITRYIVTGIARLQQLGVVSDPSKSMRVLTQKALDFLDLELQEDLENYRKYHSDITSFYKSSRVLEYAFMRTYFNAKHPIPKECNVIIKKAMFYQKEVLSQLTIKNKALLAMTLSRLEATSEAKQLLENLLQSAVVSKENGRYWKANKYRLGTDAFGVQTQALLIEAYQLLGFPEDIIASLKVYLLKSKQNGRWSSSIATANACYALLSGGANSWLLTAPETQLQIGNTILLNTHSKNKNTTNNPSGYFSKVWEVNSKDIAQMPSGDLKITNNSKVTGFGGYYVQYTQDLEAITTDDTKALTITKEIYKKQPMKNTSGASLQLITKQSSVQLGEKLTVRLLLKTQEDLEFVHITDSGAGCFTPVKIMSGYDYKEAVSYYQTQKKFTKDFFVDFLPKGYYVFEYDVFVTQEGHFNTGIAKVQSMYAPQFQNHSESMEIEVMKF